MKLLLEYLWEQRKVGLLLLTLLLVFCVVLFCSSVPLDAVLYAALLCAALMLAVGAVDFSRYCKRAKALKLVARELPYPPEHLPETNKKSEQTYQALLWQIYRQLEEERQAAHNRETETLDYYTLWAHQIKTPISAIRLLLQNQPGAQQAELENELFKVERYVDMVLGYQRLSGANNDLVLRRQSLDPLVRQSVQKFARQFIRKRIRLDYNGTDLTVLTDEKWLCFVLEQLLSNALKYTPTGGRVTLVTKGSTLLLADTGIGIAPEDLPRIFERGYTGYNGRADKRATGIGLYLCKLVLDKLGHRIHIESQVNQGTTISLDLAIQELEIE